MKLLWLGIVVICTIGVSTPLAALVAEPSPDTPPKTSSPILITNYSFQGDSVRFVQLYNASNDLVYLDGWTLGLGAPSNYLPLTTLSGAVEPRSYVTIASPTVLSGATFEIDTFAPNTQTPLSSVTLMPPLTAAYLSESASPVISSSTVRQDGVPPIFHFSRNVSTSTGNYLTSYSAYVPGSEHVVYSDRLYVAPQTVGLQIVEVFADHRLCSPFESAPDCKDYVKLKNVSGEVIDMARYRVRTGANGVSATDSNTSTSGMIVAPGRYMVVPLNLSLSGSWVWLEDIYGTVRYESSVVAYPSSSSENEHQAWSLKEDSGVWAWTTELRPTDEPNAVVDAPSVNECSGLALSEIAANVATDEQFIEIKNTQNEAVDATGCIIMTNRSQVARFTFQEKELQAGEHAVVFVDQTQLTLTKTTRGTVYILSSDASVEVDSREYDSLKEATSWANINGVWQQTYDVSPGVMNRAMPQLPCDQGYVRNPETGYCNKIVVTQPLDDCGPGKYRSAETNRCRLLATAASGLVPCATNQYRNPATNRCRATTSAASALVPCQAGQARNPATNRCRSTASQVSTLKPCAVGQERNPATNRCRKTGSDVTADFPVEAVKATAGGGIAWWAFGGAGVLAAGYAGWEWRREVLSAIKKVATFVTAGR